MYSYKRDKGARPIIVINVEKMITSGIDLNILVKMADYLLNYIKNNCLVPSKIENWTVIVDMNNVGLT